MRQQDTCDALEADLWDLGVWLGDLWTGRLSVRRAAVLASQLMPGARVYQVGTDDLSWTSTEYQLANILDAIDALGSLRELLPATYAGAWADALGPTIVWNEMAVGLAYNVGVFVVLVGIAVLRFERKDILS